MPANRKKSIRTSENLTQMPSLENNQDKSNNQEEKNETQGFPDNYLTQPEPENKKVKNQTHSPVNNIVHLAKPPPTSVRINKVPDGKFTNPYINTSPLSQTVTPSRPKATSDNKTNDNVDAFMKRKLDFIKNQIPTSKGADEFANCHKVYTAGLVTGEAVAWVADRFKADKPAFIRAGLNLLFNREELKQKGNIRCMIKRRSVNDPHAEWEMLAKNQKGDKYTLHWYFFVRFPEHNEETTHDQIISLSDRQQWGQKLTIFFGKAEQQASNLLLRQNTSDNQNSPGNNTRYNLFPNKFTYAGDSNPIGDKNLIAGSIFTVKDVMSYLIIPQFQTTSVKICEEQNDWILDGYYGVLKCEAKSIFLQPASPVSNIPDFNDIEKDDIMSAFD